MIAIFTLHADCESDRALRAYCGPCSEPFSVTLKDNPTGLKLAQGTATHLRRAVGRKHGKTVRYWAEVAK